MPVTYPGWPYAAKSVIQFEWNAVKIRIWMTFGHAMNTDDTPPLAKFTIKTDGVDRTPDLIVWIDPWTLRIDKTVAIAHPDRVLVKYDGPDWNVRTTWHKIWEPWGFILALDITT